MIIACPACTTRYVVPDSAIGVEGRTVRCAKCRHSWFQDGAPVAPEAMPAERAAAPVAAPAQESEPVSQPVAAEPASARAVRKPDPAPSPAPVDPPPAYADWSEPAPSVVEQESAPLPTPREEEYDEPSPFDSEPPFRPRRNPLKVWTAAGATFALLATGTVVAASYWGLPDWVPVSRPTFAAGNRDLVLDFPAD